MVERILRDSKLNRQLVRDGYAIVPLLDPDELGELRRLSDELGPAPGDTRDGLFNDTWAEDQDFRSAVAATLSKALDARILSQLEGYRVLGLTRILKWPGSKGAVVAHRDPSFVDEPVRRSLGIWCPLEATSIDSGGLEVVPGSHLLATGARGHQSPRNLYPVIDERSDEYSLPLSLGAGQALFYDHRTIHRSPPNQTESVRTVIGGIAVPLGVTVTYPIHSGQSTAELIEIDSDFFVRNRLDRLDEGRVLNDWPHAGRAELADGILTRRDLGRLRRRRLASRLVNRR